MNNGKRNSQVGSAHVVVIIVLIVAILGLLGFVLWQNYINKPTASMQQTQASSYAAEKTFVGDFYHQYISLGSGMNGVDSQQLNDLVTKYRVTTKSNSGDFDAVVCGQNYPATIKVNNGTKTADGISFDIEELWGESTSHVSATVSSDSKGMQITVAVCSS